MFEFFLVKVQLYFPGATIEHIHLISGVLLVSFWAWAAEVTRKDLLDARQKEVTNKMSKQSKKDNRKSAN